MVSFKLTEMSKPPLSMFSSGYLVSTEVSTLIESMGTGLGIFSKLDWYKRPSFNLKFSW